MQQYIKHAGKVIWESPSNIALVKYWGKKDKQVPCNSSISMTLSNSKTITALSWNLKKQKKKAISLKLVFEGQSNPKFSKKLESFLESLASDYPFIFDFNFTIETGNTFPHSAGIASSASSMSSIALCLVAMKQEILGISFTVEEVSNIARLGSGSASRSVIPMYARWDSKNFETAKELSDIHDSFKDMCDAVLIVSSKEKKISSTKGHQLMENHPYREMRFIQAEKNCDDIELALKNGDMETFISIVEEEALSLHGLMLSSRPGFVLLEPTSLEIIKKVQNFRKDRNIPICFTVDAGPNIHLLYPDTRKSEVHNFIENEIKQFLEDEKWIDDSIGNGPIPLGGSL
jgi:diphosphomevalonate decarboxylase